MTFCRLLPLRPLPVSARSVPEIDENATRPFRERVLRSQTQRRLPPASPRIARTAQSRRLCTRGVLPNCKVALFSAHFADFAAVKSEPPWAIVDYIQRGRRFVAGTAVPLGTWVGAIRTAAQAGEEVPSLIERAAARVKGMEALSDF